MKPMRTIAHSRASGGARMVLITIVIVERIDEKKGSAYTGFADITRCSAGSRRPVFYALTALRPRPPPGLPYDEDGEPVRHDVLTEAIGYLRDAADEAAAFAGRR